MNKISKIISYCIWIPFAVSIGAFILYLRYYLQIGLDANSIVSAQVNLIMARYMRIGLFSLFIGLLILFINRLSKFIFNGDKKYIEEHPWMDKNNVNNDKDEEFMNFTQSVDESVNISNEELTDAISIDKKEDEEDIFEEDMFNAINSKKEVEYIINDNPSIDNSLSNELKEEKILKARFINNNEDKMIEILTDDEEVNEILSLDEVVIMPEIKRETVIRVSSDNVILKNYKKCPKCNSFVSVDQDVCTNCGIFLRKQQIVKNKSNNIFKLVFDIITIILCLGLILVLCDKIQKQKMINDEKFVTNEIESIN